MRVTFLLAAVLIIVVTADVEHQAGPSTWFNAPDLTQNRAILTQMEAPIISTIIQRFALPVNPALYTGGTQSKLHTLLASREACAIAQGRYAYGTLEFAYTTNTITPDVSSPSNPFPPGRFHQDTFTGNANLSAFYTQTFVPLLNASTTPFFFHLTNTTAGHTALPDPTRDNAALELDATLLQLLSNRAHIGKIVSESKFAADVSAFTPLIKTQDADGIRTLVTNLTQAAQVLLQADSAAVALTSSWIAAGALVPSGFSESIRAATAVVFNELIDITTEIEIQYMLKRLS